MTLESRFRMIGHRRRTSPLPASDGKTYALKDLAGRTSSSSSTSSTTPRVKQAARGLAG
jgi:hypothetical protein